MTTPSADDRGRSADTAPAWWVFRDDGSGAERDRPLPALPPPPPWRLFDGSTVDGSVLAPPPPRAEGPDGSRRLGRSVGGTLDPAVVELVNAAIHLRRPLLVTGAPGTGKSSLAHQIAAELRLGPVLWWPVVSRTTLRDGLYDYDAIGRVQDAAKRTGDLAGDPADEQVERIGDYLTLGPLGTALLPWGRPRVLLIDELDKSDIDLPNDLLHVFEEGEFRIRELERAAGRVRDIGVLTADHTGKVLVREGHVRCREFPVVVITSNGEREFPPAFRRRCLEVTMGAPDEPRLAAMVAAHFGGTGDARTADLIAEFLEQGSRVHGLAADQLLNTVHLLTNGAVAPDPIAWERLRNALWHSLSKDAST